MRYQRFYFCAACKQIVVKENGYHRCPVCQITQSQTFIGKAFVAKGYKVEFRKCD